MQTMNVSLTPELIKIVQSKVESGLYGNASEVVREAIRQMEVNASALYQLKLEALKKALAPGLKAIEEGDYAPFSLEDFNRKLNKKSKKKEMVDA